MSQLTVRNVPVEIVAALKARAVRNGRSAEAEHRLILEEMARRERPKLSWEEFALRAAELRERIGPDTTGGPDSTEIIRQMRDER